MGLFHTAEVMSRVGASTHTLGFTTEVSAGAGLGILSTRSGMYRFPDMSTLILGLYPLIGPVSPPGFTLVFPGRFSLHPSSHSFSILLPPSPQSVFV